MMPSNQISLIRWREQFGGIFPDKNKVVKQANVLLALFAISPGVYIVITILTILGKPGLARNQNDVFPVLLGIAGRVRCRCWSPRFHPDEQEGDGG